MNQTNETSKQDMQGSTERDELISGVLRWIPTHVYICIGLPAKRHWMPSRGLTKSYDK